MIFSLNLGTWTTTRIYRRPRVPCANSRFGPCRLDEQCDVTVYAAGREATAGLEERHGRRRQMVREGGEEPGEEAEKVRRPRGAGEGRFVAEPQHQVRYNSQVRFRV